MKNPLRGHIILRSYFILALLVLFSFVSHSQQTVQQSDAGRYYLEHLPPGYATSGQDYPLMIFLHGHGERGDTDNLSKVARHGPPKHINNGHNMCFEVNGETECFIVLSPQQTTNRHGWLGYEVIPFVEYAINTYRVDPDRIYLTGLSMGGQGTWQAAYSAENTPNYFAALAPAPGRGGYSEACKVANDKVPVWAFHGSNDTAMKPNEGERPVKGMNACGADPAPIWTLYSGIGHSGTWQRAYRTDNSLHTPNLYQWLLSQRKGTAPLSPPTVNAGNDISITLPVNSAGINANGNDSDGSIDMISWVQTSGPNSAVFSATNQFAITVSNLIAGTYIFDITVTDNDGLTSSDQITVTVSPEPANVPPTVNAGSNISITLPTNSTTINGTVTDTDGTITSTLWEQSSGPNTATISSPGSASTGISGLVEGSYSFTLTAEDDDGAMSSDNVSVTVNPEPPNNPPVANAGSDVQITLPTTTSSLSGTANDSDGSIASILWTQTSGPATATIVSTTSLSTVINNLSVQGAYVFELQVTDDDDDTDADQVVINVNPVPPNSPPTVNAGTDATITLPTNTTNLNGSATDPDGSISSYTWSQVSGPNSASFATPGASSTNVSGLIEGVYLFTLSATDNDGATGSDNIAITVLPVPPNNPPTVNAGSDISITLPSTSTNLSSTASDSDGSIQSYSWSQLSGPASATLNTPNAQNTAVSGLLEGVYQFSIIVTDDDGAEGTDNVKVTVFPESNTPPVSNAGSDISITLPTNTATLVGQGSDADGTISSFLWSQITGPNSAVISSPNSINSNISNLIAGVYTFQLTVTDNDGDSDTDQVNVSVNPEPPNQLPIANAGPDQNLTLPTNSTVLNGLGSDPDGTIESYIWENISGPSGTFSDLEQQNLSISDLVEGIYVFDLTVTDDRGATDIDQVRVIVNASNVPPVANAGADKSITLPTSSTTLSGSANDTDGSIELVLWEQSEGPSTATISNTLNLNTTVSNLIEGIYKFNLYIQDNDGDTDSDQVIVTVNPAPANNPPSANAGADKQVILPTNQVVLNGSGADSDGSVTSYAWTQISGPNGAVGTNVSTTTATYTNLVEGIYVFRFEVTDNEGSSGSDDVRVTVLPIPGNNPPDVSAGIDGAITLPTNSLTLNGSATDTDGSISNQSWQQVSGPSTATLSNSNSLSTTVNDLVEGIYTFRLTATDNDGDNSFDDVLVTVHPDPANFPPNVEAGDNQIIQLPINQATFIAEVSDTDGTIVDIIWTQHSGPTTANLGTSNQEMLSVSNLSLGTYVFRITVTDNEGSTNFDQVNVKVTEALSNQPPLVIADNNINIFIPENQTTISATASDPDGSINTINWSQISGPNSAVIGNNAATSTAVSGLVLGTYVFKITVTDNEGLTGFDQINVRVNPQNPNVPPNANAGSDIIIKAPESTISLNGEATDSDGTIASVSWTQRSGPTTANFTDPSILKPDVSNLAVGSYIFRITVTDSDNLIDFDEVLVEVLPEDANVPPTVDVGSDLFLELPNNTVELSATAADSDGTIAATLWSVESGPSAANVLNENLLNTSITDLVDGTYIIRCTVTDDEGATAFDELTITVSENELPFAFAGEDKTITLPVNSVRLTGNGSDNDGTVIAKVWNQRSGPATAQLTIIDENTVDATGLQVGIYEFAFNVTDNKSATSTDIVRITVLSSDGNQPPVVDAGENQEVFLPASSITLRAEAIDVDGSIVSYFWEQIQGGNIGFSDPNTSELILSNLEPGQFEFQVTVEDNLGLQATDAVIVSILGLNLGILEIPRIITPNNDGINDIWELPSNETLSNCTLKIYSPSGQVVFEASPYENNWDGTHNGGELPAGAYYYQLTCGSLERSGGIRIIR